MAKNTIYFIVLALFCHGCSFFWEPHKGIACLASEHCPSEGYRCYLGKCRQNTEKRCGDLVVDEPDEQCDDGNDADGDGCSAVCKNEVCGDGVLDAGETCDDGTATDSASCDSDCTAVVCGDGHTNEVAEETCDAGTDNSDTLADACRTTCIKPACGDEVIDTDETCDDGNDADGDGCDGSCALETGWTCPAAGPCEEICGDAVTVGSETCDAGVDGTATDSASCDSDCTAVVCGDDHINTVSEECDDGNTTAGDECDAECENVFTLSTQNEQDMFVAKYDSAGVIQWAKHFGGVARDDIYDIVAASEGSFYLGGSFCWGGGSACDATFGAGENGTLSTLGGVDGFVARYSAQGELDWVHRIGGDSDQVVLRLALGAEDSVYVLGAGCRGAACTTQIPQNTTGTQTLMLQGEGASDIFWVHYDSNGTYQAHGVLAGTGEESARGLSVSESGSVFIAGHVDNNPEAYLDGAHVNTAGESDIFVKEVSDEPTWVPDYIMLGSDSNDFLKALWIDTDDMVLSGSFCGGEEPDPACALSFGGKTCTTLGEDDGFLLWLGRDKAFKSLYCIGSPGTDQIVALASEDGESMVSLALFCEGEEAGCSATIGNADGSTPLQISGVGYKDIALIKSTSTGETERIKHLASAGTDRPGDMTLLNESALAVVGSFDCTNSGCFGVRDSMGTISAGEPSIQSIGDKDIFVAVFNADGSTKWLLSAGGGMNDFASSVAPLADGGMLVAGNFCSSNDDQQVCTATFD
jgi:cysteine-rich repeat protein